MTRADEHFSTSSAVSVFVLPVTWTRCIASASTRTISLPGETNLQRRWVYRFARSWLSVDRPAKPHRPRPQDDFRDREEITLDIRSKFTDRWGWREHAQRSDQWRRSPPTWSLLILQGRLFRVSGQLFLNVYLLTRCPPHRYTIAIALRSWRTAFYGVN